MFGVFNSENAALKAAKLLGKTYPDTEFLLPLAGMPELILQ
jgi:hypothetical protein